MKKYPLIGLTLAFSLVVLPTLLYAEDAEDSRPIVIPISIQEQLKARVRENDGVRNELLASSTASTSRREQDDRIGSTSRGEVRSLIQERLDDRTELRVDIFKIRQANIEKQLTQALDNLKQIRGRIQNRIDMAVESGKNMDSAKALLVIADNKITIAENAIIAFAAYEPIATSTATTTNIILDRPREIGADAIQTIKDAKSALNDVVVAIAKAMGVTLENNQ